MRKLGLVMLVVAALMVPALAGEETSWFDLANCTICKNLAAEEGMLEAVDWETHKVSNGMLSIAMVPPEWQSAWERAGKNMQAAVERMQQGEQVPLCGFCQSHGNLMMSGAKTEEVHSAAGHISLMTSSDAKVVAMIHAHADRTIEEYKKWLAAEAAAGAGGGE